MHRTSFSKCVVCARSPIAFGYIKTTDGVRWLYTCSKCEAQNGYYSSTDYVSAMKTECDIVYGPASFSKYQFYSF